jgi:hypothetical protein
MIRVLQNHEASMSKKQGTRKAAPNGGSQPAYGPKIQRLNPKQLRSLADRVGAIGANLRDWAEALEEINSSVVLPTGIYERSVKALERWVIVQVAPGVEMAAREEGRAIRTRFEKS